MGDVAVVELVVEEPSVDRFSAGAVHVREVARLAHEILDDSMEDVPPVPERHVRLPDALLACAQAAEVLARSRANLVEELDLDATNVLAVDADLHEHDRVPRRPRHFVERHLREDASKNATVGLERPTRRRGTHGPFASTS